MYKALQDRKRIDAALKKKELERKTSHETKDAGCQTMRKTRNAKTSAAQTYEEDLLLSRHSKILEIEKDTKKRAIARGHASQKHDVSCGEDPPESNTSRFFRENGGDIRKDTDAAQQHRRDSLPPERPLRRSNTGNRLSEARRKRLEKLLEREEKRPYVMVQHKTTRRGGGAQQYEPEPELYSPRDGVDGQDYLGGEEEEAIGPEPIVRQVVGSRSEFFNGCMLVKEDHIDPGTGGPGSDPLDFDDFSSFAVEMWVLPIEDTSSQRDLRTRRSGVAYTAGLLTRSQSRADWKYLMKKGPAREKACVGNVKVKNGLGIPMDRTPKDENEITTPTILYNKSTGQVRVGLVLRQWHEMSPEKLESDSLSQLMNNHHTVWFDSQVHLNFSTWNHIALLVSPLQATLFINGQKDEAFVVSNRTQRLSFNWSPFFFGANPILSWSQENALVTGESGLVGFLYGVNVATNVEDITRFQFTMSDERIPPYPMAKNEWGELAQSELCVANTSSGFLGTVGGQGADCEDRRRQLQLDLRRGLEEQLAHKAEQQRQLELEKDRERRQVAALMRKQEEERMWRRRQEAQEREKKHAEMQEQARLAFEKKRFEALRALQEDIESSAGMLPGFQNRQDSSRRRQTQDDYCKEMKQLATLKQRSREIEKDSAQVQERLLLDMQRKEWEREEQQRKLDKLRKQQELRKALDGQIEERQRHAAYGGEQLLSTEERGLNMSVLRVLAAEKKARPIQDRQDDQAFSVLSKKEYEGIIRYVSHA